MIFLEYFLVCALGLFVGALINYASQVIPQWMEAQWRAEYAADTPIEPVANEPSQLFASGCQHCHIALKWHEHLPLLSGGNCRACAKPAISRSTGIIAAGMLAWCFSIWGVSWAFLAWSGFCASVLLLALIDWKTYLLPDCITQPLLWAGLLASALQWTGTPLLESVYGAAIGYMTLWSVYWLYLICTGQEGMGQGDFKLLAAFGAWLGWESILLVLLCASFSGVTHGVTAKLLGTQRDAGRIPFGPFLSIGAVCALGVKNYAI